jgi:hypothetical protein
MRKLTPHASASQKVENSIDDLAVVMKARFPMKRGSRKQRNDEVPFRIVQNR